MGTGLLNIDNHSLVKNKSPILAQRFCGCHRNWDNTAEDIFNDKYS